MSEHDFLSFLIYLDIEIYLYPYVLNNKQHFEPYGVKCNV